MSENGKQIYKFDSFLLDEGERRLSRDGELIPLKPKSLDLLLVLVRSGGSLVTKDELLEEVWRGAAIEESNITVHVSALRKALGVQKGEAGFIENVPKYGYRFTARVQEIFENGKSELDLEAHQKQTAEGDNSVAIDALNTQLRPPAGLPVNRRWIGALIGVILMGLGFTALSLSWRSPARPTLAESLFLQTRMTRVTTSGNNVPAAISRDGKYLSYVVRANGKQTLWVRVIANASDLQLTPPEDAVYRGMAISPDSQMIYYDKSRGSGSGIYQIPVLGGVEKKVVNSTSGPPVSFSPDGKNFAFVRWNVDEGSDDVWIANADGAGLRRLASHKIDQGDTCSPAWSPDGKLIVCPWGDADNSMSLFGIRLEDGQVSPLLARRWAEIGEAVWLADNSGLVITAKEQESDSFQIWLVTYPSGETRRITNDVNDYRFPSLTLDSSTLAAVRVDRQSNIWVSSSLEGRDATQVTFGNYDADNDQGLAWTRQGRILYASQVNGKSAIWIMDQDGSNRRQLTDYNSTNSMPAVTPDDRHIVFVSNRGKGGTSNLWKMEIDGSNPRQLTSGPIEFLPQISPDGKWIVYHSYTSGKTTLWKISVEGGEPVFLLDNVLDSYSPVSPDGRLVACVYLDESNGVKDWKIALAPFDGGPPIKLFDVRPAPLSFAPFQWTDDGKNLAYLDRKAGISNVLLLNIQSGETKQMTKFPSDTAFYFHWSNDGRLAISRGKTNQDVVLVSNV